jgi:hypothetical protein
LARIKSNDDEIYLNQHSHLFLFFRSIRFMRWLFLSCKAGGSLGESQTKTTKTPPDPQHQNEVFLH